MESSLGCSRGYDTLGSWLRPYRGRALFSVAPVSHRRPREARSVRRQKRYRMSAWFPPLRAHQRYILHDVVVIAGSVEDQLRCLTLTDLVRGIDHHRVFAPLG